MRNSIYMVLLSLLAFFVESRIEVEPSRLDLICYKTIYESSLLDATAQEACTLKTQQDPQAACLSCLTYVPLYTGNYFPRDDTGHLLLYPLAKKRFSQKGSYHVVVSWNRESQKCQAVGAIFQLHEDVPQKCSEVKYLGWGDFFVPEDYTLSESRKEDGMFEYSS